MGPHLLPKHRRGVKRGYATGSRLRVEKEVVLGDARMSPGTIYASLGHARRDLICREGLYYWENAESPPRGNIHT